MLKNEVKPLILHPVMLRVVAASTPLPLMPCCLTWGFELVDCRLRGKDDGEKSGALAFVWWR